MMNTLHGFQHGQQFRMTDGQPKPRTLVYQDNKWQLLYPNKEVVREYTLTERNTRLQDGRFYVQYFNYEQEYEVLTMQKKYFKVVSNDLSSAVQGNNTIQYKIGEFVYPAKQGSCLFAFDSLESARKAIKDCGWTRKKIFECECHGVVDINTVDQSIWYPTKTIDGTVFVQAVKLTKEIFDDVVVSEGCTLYVQFNNTGNAYNCVLAQVGPNKFQIFQKSDMNRINDDIIEGSDGIRVVHGIRWSILQEYAEKHGFTISKE